MFPLMCSERIGSSLEAPVISLVLIIAGTARLCCAATQPDWYAVMANLILADSPANAVAFLLTETLYF